MANLYQIGPIILKKANQTFYDALISDTPCAINGVTIMRKGTPEWKDYLARRRHALEGVTPPGELEGIMARVDATELHYERTGLLFAVNFTYRLENPERYVPKRVIFDKSHSIAAEVSAGKKHVDVFKDLTGPRDLQDGKIVPAHFLYDGNLKDGLSELEQKGYQFNLWDVRWGPENLENGKRTRRIEHITPIEKVSIEDILSSRRRD